MIVTEKKCKTIKQCNQLPAKYNPVAGKKQIPSIIIEYGRVRFLLLLLHLCDRGNSLEWRTKTDAECADHAHCRRVYI